MAANVFARGAHAFRPMGRKAYHKNPGEIIRETMKLEAEEVKSKSRIGDGNNIDGNLWIPHAKTRIYYPKGHEKVMEDVPPTAVKDIIAVNWFSYDDNI